MKNKTILQYFFNLHFSKNSLQKALLMITQNF